MAPNSPFHLPSYSDSASNSSTPPPNYHADPEHGEQRLIANSISRNRPTGNYTKRSRNMTIILTEQDPHAVTPSYGRHGSVNGFILVENRASITEVEVELIGEMSVAIADSGRDETTPLVDDHYTLWKHTSSSSTDPGNLLDICPNAIPFTCIFPPTFVSLITPSSSEFPHFPLPPSVSFRYPGVFIAKVQYDLKFKVTYGRNSSLRFWDKTKTMTIPINYLPRNRPLYEFSPGVDFFSDLKIAPEEWHQTVTTIKSRNEDSSPSIDCHLFVPSIKVHSLLDTIPVHINLTGPIQSLREFIPPPEPNKTNQCLSPIHVHIVRRVCVSLSNGMQSIRSSVIGEGKVHELPPHINDTGSAQFGEGMGTLHWEAEIQCSKTVTIGSFRTDGISLKDFIVLRICPAKTNSHLPSHQIEVNISLVTDSAGFDV